jgi:hypothetical protein
VNFSPNPCLVPSLVEAILIYILTAKKPIVSSPHPHPPSHLLRWNTKTGGSWNEEALPSSAKTGNHKDPGMLAHTYNPSYWGVRGRRTASLRPAWTRWVRLCPKGKSAGDWIKWWRSCIWSLGSVAKHIVLTKSTLREQTFYVKACMYYTFVIFPSVCHSLVRSFFVPDHLVSFQKKLRKGWGPP